MTDDLKKTKNLKKTKKKKQVLHGVGFLLHKDLIIERYAWEEGIQSCKLAGLNDET